MKVIFVSGKYKATTENGVYENIQHARREAHKLWEEGWSVVCPHMNTAFMGDNDDLKYLDGDLEILRRCDAIYMLNGSEYSLGAIEELKLAKELGLEIIQEGDYHAPSD